MPISPPSHAQQMARRRKALYERGRPSASARGYDRRWRRYRLMYLREHPLCVMHERKGQVREATVVDHIKPHRNDSKIFWDLSNLQALCKPCHDRKTAKENERWG